MVLEASVGLCRRERGMLNVEHEVERRLEEEQRECGAAVIEQMFDRVHPNAGIRLGVRGLVVQVVHVLVQHLRPAEMTTSVVQVSQTGQLPPPPSGNRPPRH